MRKVLPILGMVCLLLILIALPFFTACAKPAPAPAPTPAPAPAPAPAPTPIVLKFNYPQVTTHVSYPHLEWAVNEVTKRSNGQLTLQVYPAFSLGFKATTWLRDHKDGLIDISQVTNMYIIGEEPSFGILESDCLAKSRADQLKAMEAYFNFKKKVYKEVWNSEMIAAGCIPAQTAVVGTKGKQVKTIADLKGLKLRAPNARMKELLEILGAAPQTLPKSELYMALKTGVLDGFTSGYGSLYDEKLYEVLDYTVLVGTSAACQEDIVVSQRVWESLPANLKKVLNDVFGEWAVRAKNDALSGRADTRDKELLVKAGKIASEFSEAERAKVAETEAKLIEAWVQSQGGRVTEAWAIVKPFIIK